MAVHVIAVGTHHRIFSLTSTVTPEASNPDPDFRRPRVEFVRNSVINTLRRQDSLTEQETCLRNAASVAHLPYDPTAIQNCGYLARVKMSPVPISSGQSDDDFRGESSGLSYGLSLALLCAKHSGMYDYEEERGLPVFATGRLPQGGGSVLAINHLQAKLNAVCDHMENAQEKGFYFFYPKGNSPSPALNGSNEADAVADSWEDIQQRANRLNGKVIAVASLKDAVAELLGEHLKTTIDSDETFPGIKPILWMNRHLYRGRERVIDALEQKARLAYQSNQILVVEGPSGSGKSSVVLGAMAARLVHPSKNRASKNRLSENQIEGFHEPHRITPASYDNLTELLKGLLSDITDDEATQNRWLKSNTPSELTEQIKAHVETQAEPPARPYLWVIDQAEELFTHSPYPKGIANKLHDYLTAFATELNVLIISIHRIEYQSQIPWRTNNSNCLATVAIPDPTEMVELIKQQIEARGLELELSTPSQPKPLRKRIADDIDRMPLTSVGTLLQQMNDLKKQQDPSGTVLKHEYYDAVGQAQGAMAHLATVALQQADNGYRIMNPHAGDDQISTLHHCLFELFVSIDEDGSPITLAPAKQQINDYINANELWRFIDIFRNHGLIVEYGWGKVPRYKFAHDTLINGIDRYEEHSEKHAVISARNNWISLEQWWNETVDYLTWRKSIQGQLDFWVDHHMPNKQISASGDESDRKSEKRSVITYLNDGHIHEAIQYQSQGIIQYKALAQFIEQSKYQQTLQTKKKNRLLVGGIAVMVVMLTISTTLGLAAFYYYQRSDVLLNSLTGNINFLNFELHDAVKSLPSNQRIPIMEQVEALTDALAEYGDNSSEQRRQRAVALTQKADLILENDQLDAKDALAPLLEALELFQENLKQNPNNLQFKHDLSVSHLELANLHLRNGDINQALTGYKETMNIRLVLVDKDPNNLIFQQALSVSHNKLANLYLRNGDIDQALEDYQAGMSIRKSLVDKEPDNLDFQQNLSVSHNEIANIHLRNGNIDQALEDYQAGMNIRKGLVDKNPNNLQFLRDLSVSYEKLANIHLRNGNIGQALEISQEAMSIRQTLTDIDPNKLQFQWDLSASLNKQAYLQLRNGNFNQALAGYQNAMDIRQGLANKEPGNLQFQRDLSTSHDNLADMYLRRGDIDQASAGYQAAMNIRMALVEKEPNNLDFQSYLSVSHNRLAELYLHYGDINQALEGYQSAMNIRKALVDKEPDNLDFQQNLSVSHNRLANIHLRKGDTDQALAGYQAGMEIDQTLVDKDPNNLDFQKNLSVSHETLADLHLRNGEIDQALAGYQAGMEIVQALVNKDPNNLDFQRGLSVSHNQLADLYLRNGKIDQALAGYQAGMEIRQVLVNKDPNNLDFQRDLSVSHTKLADLYLRSGDIDQALARYQAGMEIDQTLVNKDSNNLDFQRGLSVSHEKLADLYLRNGDIDQALAGYQAGMEIWETLVDKDPNNLDFQRGLSVLHNKLAKLHLRNGNIDQALAGYQEGMEIRQELVDKDPQNLGFQQDLSVSHERLANLHLRNGNIGQALAGYQMGMDISKTLVDKEPNNLQFQWDLSVSHEKLANLHLHNGDIHQALAEYQVGMDTRQLLISKDPNNLRFKRGLIVSLYKLGQVSEANKNSQQASYYWTEALGKTQKLLDRESTNPDYQNLYKTISKKLAGLEE